MKSISNYNKEHRKKLDEPLEIMIIFTAQLLANHI